MHKNRSPNVRVSTDGLMLFSVKDHDAHVKELQRTLSGRAVRDMAGEFGLKKKVTRYDAKRAVLYRKTLSLPAGTFPEDKTITGFFKKHGKDFSTWEPANRACAQVTGIKLFYVECRVRVLKKAEWIKDIKIKEEEKTPAKAKKKKPASQVISPQKRVLLTQERILFSKSTFRGYSNRALVEELNRRRGRTDPQSIREIAEINAVALVQNANDPKGLAAFKKRII